MCNKIEDIYFKLINEDEINYNENGFFLKMHGRSAMFYFVENKTIVPIEAEMPGVNYFDILVYGETAHIKLKYYPENQRWVKLSLEERFRIQSLLVQWLSEKGLRHDIAIGR